MSFRRFQYFLMEILDCLPQKLIDESLGTLRRSLSNILSVENQVENIYVDFKTNYLNYPLTRYIVFVLQLEK